MRNPCTLGIIIPVIRYKFNNSELFYNFSTKKLCTFFLQSFISYFSEHLHSVEILKQAEAYHPEEELQFQSFD